MPKISVIIPVYNVEKYLRQCLDSVVNQTLRDIEIICIDDCSTDKSLEILKEYSHNDSRIKLIEQDKNQGQGIARNIAIEIAAGEYIAFLDSDDWLDINAFEYAYKAFAETSAEVIHFNTVLFNDISKKYQILSFSERVLKRYNINLKENPFYNISLLKQNCFTMLDLCCGRRMYSANFLKLNQIKFAPTKNAEDHLFVNSVLLNAKKIYYLDKNLYYYRQRKYSTVRTKSKENFCIFDSINIFKNYLIEKGFYDEYLEEFIRYKIQVYAWCYCQFPKSEQKNYLTKVKNDLDQETYNIFLEKAGLKISLLQKILSIKNEYNNMDKYKIFRFFFLKFVIKCKY